MSAEKKGLIKNAHALLEIRDIRNTIAHEYESDNLKGLVAFTLTNACILIDSVKNAKQYSGRFYIA